MFEQSDVSDYWSPYATEDETEIYYHLDKLLKTGNDSGSIPEPGNANIENWLEKRISSNPVLNLDNLRQGPVTAPCLQEIAYEDMRFDTPSGKIELKSEQATKFWGVSSLPDYSNSNLDDYKRFPLSFITPNTGNRIHSQFGNLEIIKEMSDSPAAEISPEDAALRKIRGAK
jgi:anaerobic selenocysteine-containing dehydrogenase